MDKYYKFERFLNTKICDEFELSFSDIERIAEIELPNSAYNYKEYWNPNSHVFASMASMHGYRMKPDLFNKKVLFYKSNLSNILKSKEKRTSNTKCGEIIDASKLKQYIDKFIHAYDSDANGRYVSYDHIRKAFLYNRDKENMRDYITLNLYAYLASWGMLRNSFLMQKDYLFSRPVVDVLCSEKYKPLINYNPFTDTGYKNVSLIEELVKDIRKCYKGKEYYDEGSNKAKVIDNVTDTLVSKIILGTIGCTIAYDRYVRSSLERYKFIQKLSTDSFIQLREFAKSNELIIKKELSRLDNEIYTPMKILDMYFYEKGLDDENTKKIEK